MKGKIALVSALATLVTVGGVYATWSFAENTANSASTTVNVSMTGITAATEKGTLSVMVMGENGFSLAVDDANNDHKPDIKKTGLVTVTFEPAASASEEVKQNGIDVQFTISYAPYANGPATLEEWVYDSTQIFTISSEPVHLAGGEDKKGSNGVFTWTIEASSIGIDLTAAMKEVYIDTKAEYDAMNTELGKGHFVLTVSECVTSHN
jgi:hypothetical protein